MKATPNNHRSSRADHPDLDSALRSLSSEEAERLREVWELTGHEEPTVFPRNEDVEQALGRFLSSIDGAGPTTSESRSEQRRPFSARREDRRVQQRSAARRRASVALTLVITVLVVVGLAWFWWLRPVTHVAGPGERLTLELPDGSRVELNSGSRLQHARRLGSVRRVQLAGEAFFVVQSEHARPFVVETFNAEIRVRGTRFGVRAWPGSLDAGTTVALETGEVALAPAGNPERAVEMKPGETRRLVTRTGTVDLRALSGVSVEEATAWRRGDLVFKDQFLGVILEDVERRYAVDIRVHPVHLERKRLNLALRQPKNAEAIVRDLALALGLAYRPTSTGYELIQDALPGSHR